MATELEGKVAAVTGAASGIGLASTEAMLAAGARVVIVDRDEAALKVLSNKHGDAVIPLRINLLDPKDCATLMPRVLELAGQLDILHANAGSYVGGDPSLVRWRRLAETFTTLVNRVRLHNACRVVESRASATPSGSTTGPTSTSALAKSRV